MVLMGIDWGEEHHDVCLVDADGKVVARKRVPNGLVGVTQIHELVAEHAAEGEPICVGIEVDHGLLVQALVAAAYEVYAINPMAVSRYRDRLAVARTKSDAGDARVLADLVRTDRHLHRQVRGDSELASAIRILARAHQEAVRSRRRHTNQLRSQLQEFYPALLEAFVSVGDPEAVELLLVAPTPELGRRLSRNRIGAILRRGGRKLHIEDRATAIQECLRRPQLEQPALVAQAFAKTAGSLARRLRQLNLEVTTLESQLSELFEMHPDAEIYRSLPGLGVVLGARVLGESGDDPTRYANARARRSYSGNAPRTVASGKSLRVAIRQARNDRLADAYYQAAFVCLTRSPEANAYYRSLRASGKAHSRALRALANKLARIAWTVLAHERSYEARVTKATA